MPYKLCELYEYCSRDIALRPARNQAPFIDHHTERHTPESLQPKALEILRSKTVFDSRKLQRSVALREKYTRC